MPNDMSMYLLGAQICDNEILLSGVVVIYEVDTLIMEASYVDIRFG